MSQIQIPVSGQPAPPQVPTEFDTQNGNATTSNNIILIYGQQSTENNITGITTKGGVVGTGTVNEVDVVLTNRITGTATTTDAVTPANLYTFPLGATPGVYLFNAKFTVYNLTDSLSAGYESIASVKTNGIAGTLVDTANNFYSEEGAMSGTVITNGVSGNNLILTVTGLAGKTIHYVALTEYIFVS